MSENQETALQVLPLIPTRGVIVFPGQSVVIEVGRPMSLRALTLAQQNFESKVVLTCQKDAATVIFAMVFPLLQPPAQHAFLLWGQTACKLFLD